MARQLLCCLIAAIAFRAVTVSAAPEPVPACKTVVAPFAPCGGLASGCKGDQCVDGVWAGHCCSPGQICVRKTQWYRKCEDIPLNCKPYTGPACAKVVPTYGTCGGLGSECVGCQCKDGPWDGFCCETGAVCNKKTQFYYKCEPGPNTPVVAAASSLGPRPAPAVAALPKVAALPMKPVSEVPPSKTTALPAKMTVVTPVAPVAPVVPVKAAPESPKPPPKPTVTPAKPAVTPAVTTAKPAVTTAKPAVTPAVTTAKPAVTPVKPAVAPAPANKTAATAACVGTPVPLYAACGGKGTGCKVGECADAPWAGKCCVGVCRRKTEWYWKCEEASPTQLLAGCPPWKGAPCGVRTLPEFAPCGGKGSNCTGCDCKDAPWDGQCCPGGFKCVRQTQWHWKCVK